MQAPTARNHPCPCGSGARYKHCHGAAQSSGFLTAEARFHLGNRLRTEGDVRGAIAQYEMALAIEPGHAPLLNNLGLALEAIGERARAEDCYRKALLRDASYADALGNLASMLFERQDYVHSSAMYSRLFSVRDDIPAAVWVRHAIAQQKIGALAAAEQSFRQAAARAPADPRIQANLGTLLIEQQRYAEAETPLLAALASDSNHAYALSMLALCRLQRCAWDGIESLFARIRGLLESDRSDVASNVNPFVLLPMPVSAEMQFNAARRWVAGFAPMQAMLGETSLRLVPAITDPARPSRVRRLRVGFVSSDWRDHAVARMIVEFLERIDRARFEIFGYALVPRDHSPLGRRVANAVEHFVDVSADSTPAIAQRIASAEIDVLIDLNGYTTHDRAPLFALRPAPIQINWLGYLGTLGADWFDWIVTDRFVTPDGEQRNFSERFLYLPGSLFPSDGQREVAVAAPSRSECALPADAFVFCCFNNQYKILPHVFDVWTRLLRDVMGSVLWLSPANDEAGRKLRHEAGKRGIDPARLVFAPRASPPLHLARHRHADLFLDTTPYNAGVTANDALWMGVPVVTCAGETMASRVAGSQLHAIGLPQLVTADLGAYEALARDLAINRGQLEAIKAILANNRGTYPLFDMARFTRGFEDALLRVVTLRAADHR